MRTKSHQYALRAGKSVTQQIKNYSLGLRLQHTNIPAVHLVKTDDVEKESFNDLHIMQNHQANIIKLLEGIYRLFRRLHYRLLFIKRCIE